jgi:hypothetical protein
LFKRLGLGFRIRFGLRVPVQFRLGFGGFWLRNGYVLPDSGGLQRGGPGFACFFGRASLVFTGVFTGDSAAVIGAFRGGARRVGNIVQGRVLPDRRDRKQRLVTFAQGSSDPPNGKPEQKYRQNSGHGQGKFQMI